MMHLGPARSRGCWRGKLGINLEFPRRCFSAHAVLVICLRSGRSSQGLCADRAQRRALAGPGDSPPAPSAPTPTPSATPRSFWSPASISGPVSVACRTALERAPATCAHPGYSRMFTHARVPCETAHKKEDLFHKLPVPASGRVQGEEDRRQGSRVFAPQMIRVVSLLPSATEVSFAPGSCLCVLFQ
jgi:hypothetical protein